MAAAMVAVVVPAVCALDPHRSLEEYIHALWTDKQGYPGGAVHAFAQTPDGYLWIGAENGLVRFDGLAFRLFNHDNTGVFPASAVLSLATDSAGNLWILLENRELLCYRRGVFVPLVREAGATALAPGPRGDVLVVRPGSVTRYADEQVQPVEATGEAINFLMISADETSDGSLWMGSRDRGLFAVRDGRAVGTPGLPDQKVNCLLGDGAGALWIGTDHGLALWNGTQITQSGVPAALRGAGILAMARDRDSNLWVGGSRGLMRLTADGTFEESKRRGDLVEPAGALFEDREGNLWVGRADGFERYRDKVFLSYPGGAGPVYSDSVGRTWFGASTGGLFWTRGGERHPVTDAGLGRDVVYSIAGGPGELWVGRQLGGLTHFRFQGASWSTETFTARDGLAAGPVYAVTHNRDGTVWAGSLSGGVSRLRSGHVTTYTAANGAPSNSFSAIEEGPDGVTWFATANGLSAFEREHWRTYTSEQGLPPGRINCLFADAAGVLWIGTDVGLGFLRGGRLQTLREAPEPLMDAVLGIAEDRCCLWIATARHLVRVPREKLLERVVEPEAVREFGPAEGVPSAEGVRRQRSVVRDASGRVWFSLRRAIAVVEPDRVETVSVPAVVRMQSVSADGDGLRLGNTVRVAAGHLRIRFEYVAVSLSAPERVQYRYRLDPLDHTWSEPGGARDTVYMNLVPGPYRFRVIASNSQGVWNSAEAAVGVYVAPAFWQSWLFRGMTVAVLAGAAMVMYRLRLRRVTKELSIGFQERLDERTRIAQELHDTLLQGLLATSMQLHVALDRLPADSAALPQLTRVMNMLQKVAAESRNAVRGLRSSISRSDDLERALSSVREDLAVPESVAFRIIIDGQRVPLNPQIRDEIYRIGREALSNAFRHSRATAVDLEIGYYPGRLRVAVRDTGRGIDEEVLRSGLDGHWGLIGMQESAEKIGARLRVWSRPAMGTELELTVPGDIAFRRPRSGGWRRRLGMESRVEAPAEKHRVDAP